MIRRFLVIALLGVGATVSHAQQSLPSNFQAKTIRSPEVWVPEILSRRFRKF